MTRSPRAVLLAVGLSAAVCAAGCQTTTVRSLPTTHDPEASTFDFTSPSPGSASNAPLMDNGKVSSNQAVASDASAARLHDMEGPMLIYYALHKRLPFRLEELLPLADADTDLQLNAPSGAPYVYAPFGLVATGTNKRIIVADPAPSASTGKRWCILMPPPPEKPNGALSMEVVAVPEKAFREFVPAE